MYWHCNMISCIWRYNMYTIHSIYYLLILMFTLPVLGYEYDALEPVMDHETMKIHHTKHHQTYIDKLNATLWWLGLTERPTIEELLQSITLFPATIQSALKNHGWGHHNHTLFWESLVPGGSSPSEALLQIITIEFGSRDAFQEQFTTQALQLFGSGRIWLESDWNHLQIQVYTNQENPLMFGKKPLLWLDCREHAYYLQYQNRRADYIQQRRNIINRTAVEKRIT